MNYNGQYVKSVAAATAIFALPAISGGFVWFYFLTPLPLIFLPIFLGFEKGVAVLAHSILISGVLALALGSLSVLFFSLCLLPVGFVLARSINRKESLLQSALQGAVWLAAIWLFSGVLLSAFSQSNIYLEVLNSIDTSIEVAYTAYSQSPEISADIKHELQSVFTRIRELIPKIFPGILVVFVISTIFINMTFAAALLMKNNCPRWQSFRLFRLPDHLIWTIILGGMLLFTPAEGLKAIGLNLLIVFGSLYFIQGLSVTTTFFAKWSVPKAVQVFVLFFLIIQAYGFLLLALLGIAEIWADFRKSTVSKPD
jgi:uncharacterized protein YybS (DUF2232 family)